MSKHWLTSAAVVLALLSSVCPALAQCCTDKALMCGPNCLLVVCGRLGVSADATEVASLAEKDAKGTTLAGLALAAEKKGLYACGAKMSVDDLAKLRTPAIAHLWGDHFVVVEGTGAEGLRVTDPPAQPKVVSRQDLARAYSGFALILAKDKSLLPKLGGNGPDMRFDTLSRDLGSIGAARGLHYVVRFRNVGDEALLISNVTTNCSCLVPTDWPSKVEAGAVGGIGITLDTSKNEGVLQKALYVASNDPVTPIARVAVVGYVRSERLRVEPSGVLLGRLRSNSPARGELYVPNVPEEPLELKEVISDSPLVSTTIGRSNDPKLPGYVITATLKPGAPIGEFRTKLTIVSDHPKQPKAEIPVTATIVGNIDLDRESLFLGIVKKGKDAVASVTLSTAGKDPLKLGEIENPPKYLTVEAKPKVEGKEYVLTAALKPDAPLGNIKGDVVVHTNDPDQPQIKIPVYAYVEK